MRKHFLILMLLTLLPFTAWAATVPATVDWSVDSNTLKYDGTERNLPTIDDVTEIAGFVAGNVIDLKWYRVVGTTETEIAKVGNNYPFTMAGTYKVTFGYNGKSDTYTATWLVKKEDLNVIADDFNISDKTDPKYATYHQITFGDEAPAYTWHFGDLPGAFNTPEKKAAEYATITGQEGVSFNCTYLKGSNKGNYDIIPVVSGEGRLVSENYNFVPQNGTLKVVEKALSTDATKYTITVTDKVYNARAQQGEIAIKDLTFTGDKQNLVPGADKDYVVTYWVDSNCSATEFTPGEHTYYTKAELGLVVTAVDGLTNDDTAIGENYAAINAVMGTSYTAETTRGAATAYAAFKTLVAALADGATNYVKTEGLSNHINAGTYYMKVTGKGNYLGSEIKVPFKITQKPLAISTLNKTQAYTGVKQVLTYDETTVAYEGLEVADQIFNGLPRPAAFADGVTMNVKNAKDVINVEGTASDYEIIAYAQKGGKNVNNLTQIFKNYQVAYFQGGKLTVNPKALTLTLIDQEVNFGDESDLNPGESYQPTADNAANYFTLTGFVNSEKIKTNPTLQVAVEEVAEGTGEYNITVNPETLTYQSGDGKNPIPTSNYTIAPAPTSKLTATLTIIKGFISVRPNNAGNIYGDAEAKPLTVFVNAANAEDKAKAEAVLAKAITIAGVSSEADGYATGNAYPGAGVYEMTLDFNKIKDEADYKYLAKNYNISKFTGKYTITKRALTKIEIADQTLIKDQVATDLNEDLVTFTAENYSLTDADIEKLQDEFDYAFNGTADASAVTFDGEGVNTPLVDAIMIQFNGVTAFTNFSLPAGVEDLDDAVDGKYIFGDLTVSLSTGLTINATFAKADPADPSQTELIVAADSKKGDITFSNRTLKKQVWETMVLPFETSVFEVSKKLGYAVVDLLDENANDENVHLNLWMGDIPANTPFMVKVYKEVDLSGVTFDDKTIVAPTQVDENGNPYVEDKAGHKFVGLYDVKVGLTGEGIWAINQNGVFKQLTSVTTNLDATKAYLDLTADANARGILVEEANGEVTAISTISAEVTTNTADGWYTINGVKLNNMPTEKGVYILNGKKIVVK